MKKLVLLVLALSILLLFGCAIHRQGQPAIMKKELVAQIQPGISNTKQIKSLFGEPYQRRTYNTGDKEWVYIYAENVTQFSGQVHELKVEFDKMGVVSRYAFGRVH